MTHFRRLGWFLLGAGAVVLSLAVAGFVAARLTGASRPAGPPQGVRVSYPWGSIDLDEIQIDPNSELETDIVQSILAEEPEEFDPDHDGVREYDVLILSGGGSNGAFGAGVLCGWTEAGDRPDFKIVTGVSTGALQATPAFLGPDYDDILREVYTEYNTKDIYNRRSPLLMLYADALVDTAPLKRLIDRYIDEEVLAAVAAKHKAGHRLFMGTTNVDTREFVIWDMGRIATSGREEALQLYRKVTLASCSLPVVFGPVYFAVKADDGNIYHEMHCDGGAYAQVFFRGFLIDFEDALDDAGLLAADVDIDVYIINNGKSLMPQTRKNVTPRTYSIAAVTMNNLFSITMASSLYRIYVLAGRYGFDFNLAAIGEDSALVMPPHEFNPPDMKKLFNLGRQLAQDGYDWKKTPPAIDADEIFPID